MAKPLLSIGMIFKNEIRCLERCMESLAPLREAVPCELVMADTGSDDGSWEVAEKYADILFTFPWIDDFSAARNAVLERCTGQWFFFLDADEWLAEDFPGLLRFLRTPEAYKQYNGAAILIRNYTSSKDMDMYSDFYAGRFLRMSTGGRFTGPVHENFAKYADPIVMLKGAMLHHDGYAKDIPELVQKKKGRNRPLLDKKLEDAPNDLVTYSQYLADDLSPEERYEISEKAIALIESGTAEKMEAGAVVYARAVEAAARTGHTERMCQWIQDAEARYPRSIYVRIDGEAAAANRLYLEKRYQEALEHGVKWEEGMDAYARTDFVISELTLSALNYAVPTSQCGVYATIFDCCCKLEQWERAGEYLGKIDLNYLEEGNWKALVYLLFGHTEKFQNFSAILSVLWRYADEKAGEGDEKWRSCRGFLWSAMNGAFVGNICITRGGVQYAIAALENCDAGRSARIFLTDSLVEKQMELEQIENWDDVFYMVYPVVFDAGIALPESFFQRTSEQIAETAANIASVTRRLPDLLTKMAQNAMIPPCEAAWLMDLAAAAARKETVWEDEEQGNRLCALFIQYARQHLKALYRQEVLREETILLLPGLQRFAWFCLQAAEAKEKQMYTEAVRWLRKAVGTAPAMKAMTEFMMREIVQAERTLSTPPSGELLALAEQVRAILSQYPPDDPAVQAIKQGEEYRKVVHLIEGPDVGMMGVIIQ